MANQRDDGLGMADFGRRLHRLGGLLQLRGGCGSLARHMQRSVRLRALQRGFPKAMEHDEEQQRACTSWLCVAIPLTLVAPSEVAARLARPWVIFGASCAGFTFDPGAAPSLWSSLRMSISGWSPELRPARRVAGSWDAFLEVMNRRSSLLSLLAASAFAAGPFSFSILLRKLDISDPSKCATVSAHAPSAAIKCRMAVCTVQLLSNIASTEDALMGCRTCCDQFQVPVSGLLAERSLAASCSALTPASPVLIFLGVGRSVAP